MVLPVPSAHIQLASGGIIDLANFRHARFGFFGGNNLRAALALQAVEFAYFLR